MQAPIRIKLDKLNALFHEYRSKQVEKKNTEDHLIENKTKNEANRNQQHIVQT